MSDLPRVLEALLFLSPEPVPLADLAEATEVAQAEARQALEALGEHAERSAASCCARSPAATRSPPTPNAEEAARRLLAKPRTPPLTQAQAETLAIVAYLQPVSRPEIARIRGVNAESATQTLLERGLIEESGRSQFGAILYRTTDLFMRLFGLNAIGDLPDLAQWDPTPGGRVPAARSVAARGRGARR